MPGAMNPRCGCALCVPSPAASGILRVKLSLNRQVRICVPTVARREFLQGGCQQAELHGPGLGGKCGDGYPWTKLE